MNLVEKTCVPCEGGVEPFNKKEADKYMAEISGWSLDNKVRQISKEYKFKDHTKAMNFIKNVSAIAETEGHHPDMHIFYNKVLLELSTHSINGLSENDFIIAAKIDAMS